MKSMVRVSAVALVAIAASCGGGSDDNDGGSPGQGGSGGALSGGSGGKSGSQGGSGGASGGSSSAGKSGAGGSSNAGGTSSVGGASNVGGASDDGGAPTSGGSSGQGGSGGGGGDIVCSCSAQEACIKVTVTRQPATTNQPWILWPNEADGAGTLVVGSLSMSSMLQARETVGAATFIAADSSYGVALCVPAGDSRVSAFLDDDSDAAQTAVSSSDYLDSCPAGDGTCFRCYELTVAAGTETELAIGLANSCD